MFERKTAWRGKGNTLERLGRLFNRNWQQRNLMAINVHLAMTLAKQAGITDPERIADLVHHAGIFLMRANAKLEKALDRDGAIDTAIEAATEAWKALDPDEQTPEAFMDQLEAAL